MVLELVTARCPNLAGSGTPGAVVCQLVGEAKVQGTPGLVSARWWAEYCPWVSGSGALESWPWCLLSGMLEDRARSLGWLWARGFFRQLGCWWVGLCPV